MLSQMALVAAIAAEIDRQLPGAVVNGAAMNAIIAAADAILAAQRGITVPNTPAPREPVTMSQEEQMVALDRLPGWEAA